MELNVYGQIVCSKWMKIPTHFKNAQLDVSQIMPDHLHGIIILTDKTNIMVEGAKHCRKNFGQNLKDRTSNASPLPILYQPKPVHPAGT
jgi:REP element-mobilizing transposase RayT